ncbi:MAG: hypothetical protein LKG27_00645 [Clostridiaceae bacterium]|jgi:hypothetical protein|nr:hypothetical protein [Clostridiaceae bacterium]
MVSINDNSGLDAAQLAKLRASSNQQKVRLNDGTEVDLSIFGSNISRSDGNQDFISLNADNSVALEASSPDLNSPQAKGVLGHLNPDGSGTLILVKQGKDGKPVRITSTYGKGRVLQRIVREDSQSTITTEIKYGDNKKISQINNVIQNKAGKILKASTTKNRYDSKNNLIETNVETQAILNKKVVKTSSHKTMEYVNGKKVSSKTNGVNVEGKPYSAFATYEADGKTVKTFEQSSYKRGALVKESYSGANLKNRMEGGLPDTKIEYEADGKTIKQTTKNLFDAEGIFIGREIYDGNGKLVRKRDFSKLDGKFDTAYQIGKGDCYLLASINALANTPEGQKLLQQDIKETTNEKGEKVYVVSFPGAKKARESLINGTGNVKMDKLPEDKVHIQESYTITESELKEASKRAGKDFSAGDKDVLLMEVAYGKYRDDVAKTITDNKLDPRKTSRIAGLGIEKVNNGDNLSGGLGSEAMFILTGKQSEEYVSTSMPPVCYIDSNLQMHVPDEAGSIGSGMRVKALAVSVSTTKPNELDSLLDKLKEDSKDGKIDNYAATAGFKVATQEVNGQTLQGGGHALTILKVDDKQVTLANPWDPDSPITMSIEDFKKSITKLQCLQTKEGSGNNSSHQIPHNGNGGNNGGVPHNGNSGGSGNGVHNGDSDITNPSQNKPNHTIKQGQGYTALIKQALIEQGIEPTAENIKKAKAQFEEANPDAIRTYKGRNRKWQGNKFLYANAEVFIPTFDISKSKKSEQETQDE